jgi:hypothetical protein
LEIVATGGKTVGQLLTERLPLTFTRIRRSLKPKRLALIDPALNFVADKFTPEALGCGVLLDGSQAFRLDGSDESVEQLRCALGLAAGAAR